MAPWIEVDAISIKHDPRCKCDRCTSLPCPHDRGLIEYADGTLICDRCWCRVRYVQEGEG